MAVCKNCGSDEAGINLSVLCIQMAGGGEDPCFDSTGKCIIGRKSGPKQAGLEDNTMSITKAEFDMMEAKFKGTHLDPTSVRRSGEIQVR